VLKPVLQSVQRGGGDGTPSEFCTTNCPSPGVVERVNNPRLSDVTALRYRRVRGTLFSDDQCDSTATRLCLTAMSMYVALAPKF
jgi:hypothetical protein